MKTYLVTVYGTHENRSWEWSQTVEVQAPTVSEARRKAVKLISWPPTAGEEVTWKVHRVPSK